jgi:tetratricopeptide (TPR) repeat protein
VKLNNGTDNPILYALGWAVEKDTMMGKIVYHTGNDVGLSCDLIRNISKHQTVIIVDIAHPNAHYKGMNAMRILNKYPVGKPKKSVARTYCQTLVKSGPATATAMLERLRKDTVNYVLDEDEMNFIAYDLITDNTTFHFESPHLYSIALEIFRMNTKLFPASWNAFDSYGEILLKLNKKQEAKKMYQKSLELNPKNDNAEKVIQNMDKN